VKRPTDELLRMLRDDRDIDKYFGPRGLSGAEAKVWHKTCCEAADEIERLQTRVEELEGDVRTHFEHGWNRGFHAGSAQVNTLPSDWRGYRAIIEQGEKDE